MRGLFVVKKRGREASSETQTSRINKKLDEKYVLGKSCIKYAILLDTHIHTYLLTFVNEQWAPWRMSVFNGALAYVAS